MSIKETFYFFIQTITNYNIYFSATCRCGSQKSGVHLIKCLKQVSGNSLTKMVEKNIKIKLPPLPQTSSKMIGLQHNFLSWERSTYYVSPKVFVPKRAKVGYGLFRHIMLG